MTPLTAEQWHRIDELFEQALERDPADRHAWLTLTCADDRQLLDSVLGLLDDAAAAEAAVGESVEDFAPAVMAQLQQQAAAPPLPTDGRIGPYRLIREIGRGGMGTVYLAERADAEFEKNVAIKVVKRGMDTDEVLLRFRYERQILASLEHPHIGRLYDGGATVDGVPYLVMEYIEGEPITQYCNRRALGIAERLRLFADVCAAVQYAHRNLVVHRDIKPSNILIDSEGRPKLLDFGIAKLLNPAEPGSAPVTRTEHRLLTPEYASPEQRVGGVITTATDVYSLGMVLYELVTGARADAAQPARPSTRVDRMKPDEVLALAQQCSTTPDRLRRRLRGDVDTIVLRAVAEAAEHRYASAEQLETDINNHLRGLPVTARGDSLRYRAARFVRRNPVPIVAAALVLLSLTSGLGAALWQAQRAAAQRDQAQQERARAEQVSTFMLSLFEGVDPLSADGGDTLRVRTLVERGAGRVVSDLSEQPRLQAQMLTTLARAYINLGMYAEAQDLLHQSIGFAADRDFARERAAALAALADVAYWHGDHAAADTLHRAVAALYSERTLSPDATYVRSISRWGNSLEMLGRAEEAKGRHERALELVRTLELEGSGSHSLAVNNLAVHYWNLGDYASAEPLFRQAVEVTRTAFGPTHPEVALNLNNLASTVQSLQRLDEAEALYLETISIARQAYGDDHVHVGQFIGNYAGLLEAMQRHADAEPLYREALRIMTAALGADNPRVAMLQRNFASSRYDAGDYAAAQVLDEQSVAAFRAAYGRAHFYTALAEASLGRTLAARGRAAEALPLLRDATATLDTTAPEGHRWRVHTTRSQLAVAMAAVGRVTEAEAMLLDAYAALLADRGADDFTTSAVRARLHTFYSERGRAADAARYRAASH